MKNKYQKILSIGEHILALGVLAAVYWQFAQKYLYAGKPSGNDYYVGLNYVEFFHKHLTWPVSSWENFWAFGEPAINGYPWFHNYLVLPLVPFFGTAGALEIYSVATLFLFFVFSYILFFELSKNKIFSFILTFLLLYSRGIFNALPWNGFMGASATQMFLPLAIYLIIRFLRTGKKKFLIFSGLISGLAIMGHPMTGGFFIVIPSVILLLFWNDETTKFLSFKKISYIFTLGLVVIATSLPGLFSMMSLFGNKLSGGMCVSSICWGDIPRLAGDINPLFFVLTIILISACFVLKLLKKKLEIQLCLIFAMPLLFFLSFLAGEKLNLLSSISITIWPERVIWALTLFLGCFLATLLGNLSVGRARMFLVFNVVILVIIGAIWSQGWFGKAVGWNYSTVFSGVGAWPADNHTYATDKYWKKDVRMVLPSWLNKDDIQYRLDSQNYMFNFWWPLAINVQGTRGYTHFYSKNQSYWNGWLTAGLINYWGDTINRPKEVSQNTALFLLDWFAVRYIDDSNRRLGIDKPYIDYILQSPISDQSQEIGETKYYRIAEQITSPIVKASNAKTILVVGLKSTFVYDNFTKVLAGENVNSKFLITVRGPDTLDDLKNYHLSDFDVIFLNDYRYKDYKSWRVLEDYVKAGGKLIIETSTQVRESDSSTLPEGQTQFPEVFPMTAAKRESLGDKWQLQPASNNPILEGIKLDEFGPLVYEGAPWKLSYIPSMSDLKPGAEVVLSQAGQPILVSQKLGQGEVVWSGMSLSYHFLYYDRLVEAKFLQNIISYLTSGLPNGETAFSFERKSPEQIKISGQNFSGVVFKENINPGWRAKVNGKSVAIYSAGPDFMYVKVPKGTSGNIIVELYYRGTNLAWLTFLFWLGAVGYSISYFIFGKGIKVSLILKKLNLEFLTKGMRTWWSKEEDEQ